MQILKIEATMSYKLVTIAKYKVKKMLKPLSPERVLTFGPLFGYFAFKSFKFFHVILHLY